MNVRPGSDPEQRKIQKIDGGSRKRLAWLRMSRQRCAVGRSVRRSRWRSAGRFYWSPTGCECGTAHSTTRSAATPTLRHGAYVTPGANFDATLAMTGSHTPHSVDRSAMAAVIVPWATSRRRHVAGKTTSQSASGFGDSGCSSSYYTLHRPEGAERTPDVVRYEPGFSVTCSPTRLPIGEYNSNQR